MLRSIALGLLLVSLAAALVLHPSESLQSALQGLTVWWEIVFPGLLPFYVLSELLFALGAVHALGALLEPLMRQAFRLPGDAGWAVALGWTAGFPAGAEAAARLHQRRRGFHDPGLQHHIRGRYIQQYDHKNGGGQYPPHRGRHRASIPRVHYGASSSPPLV
ncbi:hypothetical protein BG53_09150 [Paenibacillus darwinianus]|uniref:Nucleoside transporter/FeoB GTPase Gate domain-containing protein n=1 Tax=Paenibacillus darwinianus TaxID=1380763 RepID=A0A9W5RYU8_9BACL|nr:hypothetical protein [Paenibacillus darwinianus]EXX85221.1 hypothetical protein BG53_09150 [Paenibacillus darwinianus]